MQEKNFFHVGCYVRVSTENQLENYSIEEQTDRLKAYCAAKGWTIYKIYTDPGFSGGNTNRPALRQLLQDVSDGRLDMVAVYRLDRLSRSQKDTLTLIEDRFIAHHVEFVSISENFDTSTPFGRAMVGILSVFAQLEKDQITERFTMGRIGRSKAGLYHGGPTPPTGYRYTNGRLVVDVSKALQVREVFARFLGGCSIHSIQKFMHEKYGGWSSHSLVAHVLKNSVYVGKVKFKGREYDGIHAPIVSKSVFQRTQALLRSGSQKGSAAPARKPPFRAGYLLSGLLFCDRCGARYSANHGFYKCYSRAKSDPKYITDPNCKNKNWPITQLDALILREIKKLRYDQSCFLAAAQESTSLFPAVDRDAMAAREKELISQSDRMITLYQSGAVPLEEAAKRILSLQKERDFLNQQILEQEAAANAPVHPFIPAQNRIDAVFSSAAMEEKRAFTAALIESIRIDGETIKIKWRI